MDWWLLELIFVGVMVLLGDSGVRFVSNNVTLATWRALSSPQGGETLGEF